MSYDFVLNLGLMLENRDFRQFFRNPRVGGFGSESWSKSREKRYDGSLIKGNFKGEDDESIVRKKPESRVRWPFAIRCALKHLSKRLSAIDLARATQQQQKKIVKLFFVSPRQRRNVVLCFSLDCGSLTRLYVAIIVCWMRWDYICQSFGEITFYSFSRLLKNRSAKRRDNNQHWLSSSLLRHKIDDLEIMRKEIKIYERNPWEELPRWRIKKLFTEA